MNEYRKKKFIKKIFNKLFNTINGKEITIYGFSFKKDTKDTRHEYFTFLYEKINDFVKLINII